MRSQSLLLAEEHHFRSLQFSSTHTYMNSPTNRITVVSATDGNVECLDLSFPESAGKSGNYFRRVVKIRIPIAKTQVFWNGKESQKYEFVVKTDVEFAQFLVKQEDGTFVPVSNADFPERDPVWLARAYLKDETFLERGVFVLGESTMPGDLAKVMQEIQQLGGSVHTVGAGGVGDEDALRAVTSVGLDPRNHYDYWRQISFLADERARRAKMAALGAFSAEVAGDYLEVDVGARRPLLLEAPPTDSNTTEAVAKKAKKKAKQKARRAQKSQAKRDAQGRAPVGAVGAPPKESSDSEEGDKENLSPANAADPRGLRGGIFVDGHASERGEPTTPGLAQPSASPSTDQSGLSLATKKKRLVPKRGGKYDHLEVEIEVYDEDEALQAAETQDIDVLAPFPPAAELIDPQVKSPTLQPAQTQEVEALFAVAAVTELPELQLQISTLQLEMTQEIEVLTVASSVPELSDPQVQCSIPKPEHTEKKVTSAPASLAPLASTAWHSDQDQLAVTSKKQSKRDKSKKGVNMDDIQTVSVKGFTFPENHNGPEDLSTSKGRIDYSIRMIKDLIKQIQEEDAARKKAKEEKKAQEGLEAETPGETSNKLKNGSGKDQGARGVRRGGWGGQKHIQY